MMKDFCFYLLAAGALLSSTSALRPMDGHGDDFSGAARWLQETDEDYDDDAYEVFETFEEESDCTAPGSMESFRNVIKKCKFAAPTSKDQIDNDELEPYCSKYFRVKDGYMRFVTDDERAELRIPNNDEENGEGFSLKDTETSLKGTLRITRRKLKETDEYTWMQLHGAEGAYIRLTHYGRKNVPNQDEDAYNWMWMYIKTGSSKSPTTSTSVAMGPMPEGDFDASIVVKDNKVTISADEFSQTFDIEWTDDVNFFKAGVYVQEGNPTDFKVDYKSLTYNPPG